MSTKFWVSRNEKGYVVGQGNKEIAQLGPEDKNLAVLFASAPELKIALEKALDDATKFLNEGDFKKDVTWDSGYILDTLNKVRGIKP